MDKEAIGLSRVQQFSQHAHSETIMTTHSVNVPPDRDDLANVEVNAVHLCYKDGCDSLVERRAIHVDSGANGQHEACHSLVDAVVLLQTPECDGEGRRTERKKIKSKINVKSNW